MQTGFIPISEQELRATNQHLVDLLREERRTSSKLRTKLAVRDAIIVQQQRVIDDYSARLSLSQMRAAACIVDGFNE